ncbi:DNA topoisomerase III [Ligilactobacillus salivarius]|uniref:DNA topoisomerase III n=1 Tax=Ligilactobacillus salivarius TaxID=1624 RepID=UPI00136E9F68|nr:DNA topoisomerase III [Ligilactobacillus salivarius]MYU60582.1 DNA topoisomerase III [Ligilactobacillus salivarius]MYU84197.1 DNA topoisomerase III [Ligilactobacillus salivarius]MYU86329.1 DNA topoisomerase III [Ligilactobacillus salivarius]MYU88095.1 DNA topoisomerase III [Ligilactobacillus salivarius]MYU91854.1 DNA topoisomerase III [Ligilactobacillus salivarius]
MKKLILAEKPSVARDIGRILNANEKKKNYLEGKNYVITWALGHLLGLKMPEDLNKKWEKWQLETLPMLPKFIGTKPLPKTRSQLKTIESLVKRKDINEIVIATDAGREGELVARWILQYVHANKKVTRLWISSQTDKAVKQGFKELKPAEKYDNLYESALARATADWLVGLNVTRALTVKYQDNLSAGRVQTPTLALVRRQEEKIEKFMPQKYYRIALRLGNQTAYMKQKNIYAIKERDEAEKKKRHLDNFKGQIRNINSKVKREAAPLLYDLTELQREANKRYGYSAKKTLSLVQSLYEIHKVVSYPRTDSRYLSNDIKSTLMERLQAIRKYDSRAEETIKNKAKVILKKVFNDSKVTDHHALIPTEQVPNYSKFSADEQKIYNLIVSRFLGIFAQPYTVEELRVVVTFDKDEFIFVGKKVLDYGWKNKDASEEVALNLKKDTIVSPNFTVEEKLTTPPSPLTEAGLLAQMEKFGLGTPATRAEIIEKLVKSELMERTGYALRVTPKGKQLLNLVNKELVSPKLTAKWEKQLEDIAHGKMKSQKFIGDIKNDTKRLVSEVKNSKEDYKDFSLTKKRCPECNSFLKVRKTRDGEIYVCSNPECNYRRRKDAKVSNHRCPQCHRKMLIVEGKNGKYFRCKYDGTTEKMTVGKKNKKMTKHEERRLLKKINKDDEPQESPLALALKAAMSKNE